MRLRTCLMRSRSNSPSSPLLVSLSSTFTQQLPALVLRRRLRVRLMAGNGGTRGAISNDAYMPQQLSRMKPQFPLDDRCTTYVGTSLLPTVNGYRHPQDDRGGPGDVSRTATSFQSEERVPRCHPLELFFRRRHRRGKCHCDSSSHL